MPNLLKHIDGSSLKKSGEPLYFHNQKHCVETANPDVRLGSVEWLPKHNVFAIWMGSRYVHASNGFESVREKLIKIFDEHKMEFESWD